MNQNAEERLMRYVDGELDAAEAARVERWLSRSPEARAFYGDLELVRRQVRSIAESYASRSDGLTDAVMARIECVRGEPRTAGVRGSPVLRGRIHAVIPAVGLAFAAAAAVLVFVRPHSGRGASIDEPARVAVSKEPPTAVSAVVADTAASEPENGASIESVDLGAQNGAIFMVATGPDVTPVVWLTDDGDPSNG